MYTTFFLAQRSRILNDSWTFLKNIMWLTNSPRLEPQAVTVEHFICQCVAYDSKISMSNQVQLNPTRYILNYLNQLNFAQQAQRRGALGTRIFRFLENNYLDPIIPSSSNYIMINKTYKKNRWRWIEPTPTWIIYAVSLINNSTMIIIYGKACGKLLRFK